MKRIPFLALAMASMLCLPMAAQSTSSQGLTLDSGSSLTGNGSGWGGSNPGPLLAPPPPSAPSDYCYYNPRPSAYIAHYQWGMPTLDPTFTPALGDTLLNLPGTGGSVNLVLTTGTSYHFRFRPRAQMLLYPGDGSYQAKSIYRTPGYNEQYPYSTDHNYGCAGGTYTLGFPIDGAGARVEQGDPGTTSINGINFVGFLTTFIPPADSNTAVYGFDWTPSASQAGRQYQISFIAQSSVTLANRQQFIFEGDQSRWLVNITVQNPAAPAWNPTSLSMETSSGSGIGCVYVAPTPQSAVASVTNGLPGFHFSTVKRMDDGLVVSDPGVFGLSFVASGTRDFVFRWNGQGNAVPALSTQTHDYQVTFLDAANRPFVMILKLRNVLLATQGCGTPAE